MLPKGSDALPAPTKPEETTEVVKPDKPEVPEKPEKTDKPAKPEKVDKPKPDDAERAKALFEAAPGQSMAFAGAQD